METDPEKGGGDYSFDNPGFKDVTLTTAESTLEKSKLESSPLKTKWNQWPQIGVLSSKNERKRTLDDSKLEDQEKIVSLRSHDFTGLGFNICGSMKEGIYIKDVLNKGPAFESKLLSSGDRITSVTIDFEHIVYEDALAILSYASPYEVVIAAKNKKGFAYNGPAKVPRHLIFRSSSTMDLNTQQKTKRNNATIDESNSEIDSNYSSLQKSRSTVTTLERSKSKSPKPMPKMNKARVKPETPPRVDSEMQRSENKHQKFGVKVLPMVNAGERNLKTNELLQNDNNLNIETTTTTMVHAIDEVDRKQQPPIKKREKLNKVVIEQQEVESPFDRESALNSSGIKRDENNIPLEIPNTMLNAAVAARRNRKAVEEEEVKSPKKPKGKAPSPPEFKLDDEEEKLDYNSDSDIEVDNHYSVNTIELNASDITVHQSEENEERQNRKTASTGDLTKIKSSKTSTLERAQSLDITDNSLPTMPKKRKSGKDEDGDSQASSDESLYRDALINKEPRLSLILDGLNTFQRNRLKKSSEWGNLEDAILKQDDSSESVGQRSSFEDLKISMEDISKDFGAKSEFDALVSKINEIKQETIDIINGQRPIQEESTIREEVKPVKNQIWPIFENNVETGERILRPEIEMLHTPATPGHSLGSFASAKMAQEIETITETKRIPGMEPSPRKLQQFDISVTSERSPKKNVQEVEVSQRPTVPSPSARNLQLDAPETGERSMKTMETFSSPKKLEGLNVSHKSAGSGEIMQSFPRTRKLQGISITNESRINADFEVAPVEMGERMQAKKAQEFEISHKPMDSNKRREITITNTTMEAGVTMAPSKLEAFDVSHKPIDSKAMQEIEITQKPMGVGITLDSKNQQAFDVSHKSMEVGVTMESKNLHGFDVSHKAMDSKNLHGIEITHEPLEMGVTMESKKLQGSETSHNPIESKKFQEIEITHKPMETALTMDSMKLQMSHKPMEFKNLQEIEITHKPAEVESKKLLGADVSHKAMDAKNLQEIEITHRAMNSNKIQGIDISRNVMETALRTESKIDARKGIVSKDPLPPARKFQEVEVTHKPIETTLTNSRHFQEISIKPPVPERSTERSERIPKPMTSFISARKEIDIPNKPTAPNARNEHDFLITHKPDVMKQSVNKPQEIEVSHQPTKIETFTSAKKVQEIEITHKPTMKENRIVSGEVAVEAERRVINMEPRTKETVEISSKVVQEVAKRPIVPERLSRSGDDSHKPMITREITKNLGNQVVSRAVEDFILGERMASYMEQDTNISDDVKFLERHRNDNISNVTVLEQPQMQVNETETVIVSTPDLIKSINIPEAGFESNVEVTMDCPSSLTFEITGDLNDLASEIDIKESDFKNEMNKDHSSLTYITEIQVLTPNNNNKERNVSEIEIIPQVEEKPEAIKNLDNEFENYLKKFEHNIQNFENNINSFEKTIQDVEETAKKDSLSLNSKSVAVSDKVDPAKELLKVQEIVEEQLKKLPEMRFTTSSYESQVRTPEMRQSQIEILRSNFERPKSLRSEVSPPKSRIPVLNKTPPTSPERRDSKNLETEPDRELLEMMSSHNPVSLKHQPKAANRNITVTSIRTNSKIPSGLPTYSSRPPVPPKKAGSEENLVQISSNGSADNFKQWVFNPNLHSSVTNITVTDTKSSSNQK